MIKSEVTKRKGRRVKKRLKRQREGEGQDSSLSSGFGLEGFTATAIKVREIGIKI